MYAIYEGSASSPMVVQRTSAGVGGDGARTPGLLAPNKVLLARSQMYIGFKHVEMVKRAAQRDNGKTLKDG